MLYTKLLEIAQDESIDVLTALNKMFSISFQNIKDNTNEHDSGKTFREQFIRVNNTWNLVSKKSGEWIKKDAFLIRCRENKEFSKLLNGL